MGNVECTLSQIDRCPNDCANGLLNRYQQEITIVPSIFHYALKFVQLKQKCKAEPSQSFSTGALPAKTW